MIGCNWKLAVEDVECRRPVDSDFDRDVELAVTGIPSTASGGLSSAGECCARAGALSAKAMRSGSGRPVRMDFQERDTGSHDTNAPEDRLWIGLHSRAAWGDTRKRPSADRS